MYIFEVGFTIQPFNKRFLYIFKVGTFLYPLAKKSLYIFEVGTKPQYPIEFG